MYVVLCPINVKFQYACDSFDDCYYKYSRLVSYCCDAALCRECLGEAHEPASCENWKNWHQKIADIRPEECMYLLQLLHI